MCTTNLPPHVMRKSLGAFARKVHSVGAGVLLEKTGNQLSVDWNISGVLFGALFIEFVPNLADQLTVSFGESAKALPGAIYGALLILVMAAMPTGAAGAVRAAARAVASFRQPKHEKGDVNVAVKYEEKGEAP